MPTQEAVLLILMYVDTHSRVMSASLLISYINSLQFVSMPEASTQICFLPEPSSEGQSSLSQEIPEHVNSLSDFAFCLKTMSS